MGDRRTRRVTPDKGNGRAERKRNELSDFARDPAARSHATRTNSYASDQCLTNLLDEVVDELLLLGRQVIFLRHVSIDQYEFGTLGCKTFEILRVRREHKPATRLLNPARLDTEDLQPNLFPRS